MNARLLKGTQNVFSTIWVINGSVLSIADLFRLCIRTPLSVSNSVHIVDANSFEPQLSDDVFLLNSTYEKLSFTSCNIMSFSTILLQSEHLEWGLGFQDQQSFQVCYLYSYTHFHLNIWVSSGLQQTWNFKVIWFPTLPKYFVLPSKEPRCWRM